MKVGSNVDGYKPANCAWKLWKFHPLFRLTRRTGGAFWRDKWWTVHSNEHFFINSLSTPKKLKMTIFPKQCRHFVIHFNQNHQPQATKNTIILTDTPYTCFFLRQIIINSNETNLCHISHQLPSLCALFQSNTWTTSHKRTRNAGFTLTFWCEERSLDSSLSL